MWIMPRGSSPGFVDEAVEYLPAYYNLISLPSEAADIRTKLQDISNQYLTQMIGGQMDVETAWPNYVAEYEAPVQPNWKRWSTRPLPQPAPPRKLYSALPAAAAPLWGAAPCPEPRHDGIPGQTEKYAPRAARRRTKRFRRV